MSTADTKAQIEQVILDFQRQVPALERLKLVFELDRVCLRDEFPAVAETLLQNFDTLTRLSQTETRVSH